jgi:hypothetical protein
MALLGQLRRMKYLAKVRQFHVHVRFRGHVHFCVLSVSVSVSMSVSVSVSMFVSVSMSISMLFQFKYGATVSIFLSNMAIYVVNSQGSYEVTGKLKGPFI